MVVVHREAMVAEGIAAALASYPGICPVGAVATAKEAELVTRRSDAVAIDARCDGADRLARVLRRRGQRVVMIGEEVCDEGVWVSLNDHISSLALALAPHVRVPQQRVALTRREDEVLSLVASGMSARQIAHQLGISGKTVEGHKASIYSKLGVANQAAAVSATMVGQGGTPVQWMLTSI